MLGQYTRIEKVVLEDSAFSPCYLLTGDNVGTDFEVDLKSYWFYDKEYMGEIISREKIADVTSLQEVFDFFAAHKDECEISPIKLYEDGKTKMIVGGSLDMAIEDNLEFNWCDYEREVSDSEENPKIYYTVCEGGAEERRSSLLPVAVCDNEAIADRIVAEIVNDFEKDTDKEERQDHVIKVYDNAHSLYNVPVCTYYMDGELMDVRTEKFFPNDKNDDLKQYIKDGILTVPEGTTHILGYFYETSRMTEDGYEIDQNECSYFYRMDEIEAMVLPKSVRSVDNCALEDCKFKVYTSSNRLAEKIKESFFEGEVVVQEGGNVDTLTEKAMQDMEDQEKEERE